MSKGKQAQVAQVESVGRGRPRSPAANAAWPVEITTEQTEPETLGREEMREYPSFVLLPAL